MYIIDIVLKSLRVRFYLVYAMAVAASLLIIVLVLVVEEKGNTSCFHSNHVQIWLLRWLDQASSLRRII